MCSSDLHRFADCDGGDANGIGEMYHGAYLMWSKLYWTGEISPLRANPLKVYFPNTSFDCGDGTGVPWSCANCSGTVWLTAEHGIQPDVVQHEFAHQLDSESGSTNGAPILGSTESYQRWSEILSRDFELLRRDTYWGYRDVLDPYGASSPAEFFAVATESFFEQPNALAARHPDLYAEFRRYFRVDPRDWFPQPLWQEPEPQGMVYGQWR